MDSGCGVSKEAGPSRIKGGAMEVGRHVKCRGDALVFCGSGKGMPYGRPIALCNFRYLGEEIGIAGIS
jgi:hypothetical protein